jgi:AraC family transcriptional regulator, arabinose operon regulatory protein
MRSPRGHTYDERVLSDGFPGQRLRVLPRPLVADALMSPVTAQLLVTDAGYFPHAAEHGKLRPAGSRQAILIFCVEGAGYLEFGAARGAHEVRPGSVAIIPADAPHRYWADQDDPWTIWWIHLEGALVGGMVEGLLGDERRRVIQPVRDMFAATLAVDRALMQLERDETVASVTSAAAYGWTLLAQLTAGRAAGGADDYDRIKAAQDILRARLSDHISVGQLAGEFGLSASHFSALFRTQTGMSITEYVKRLRNSSARELLLSTEMTVAEVGSAVGYHDQFYFSRQFRSVTGISPREFRRIHLSESIIRRPAR